MWKKIRTSSFDFSEVNFANGLSAIILLILLTLLNGKKQPSKMPGKNETLI